MTDTVKKTICLLLSLLLLTGCGLSLPGGTPDAEAEPEEIADPAGTALTRRVAADRVFTLNFDPEGGTNPIKAKSAANMQFWSLLYDSMFIVDEAFNVSSELVTAIHTEDFEWWTFDLRSDVCFSDGTPLTARDVAYSIVRAQESSYYGSRLSCVYGVSPMGDDCVAISTKYPNSQLTALLNIPIIKSGEINEVWPLGSGPFMLNEERTALTVNPYGRHTAELPVDTVYLADYMDSGKKIGAFEEALIDLVTNDPTGMYNLGYASGSEKRYYDTTNLHFVSFNTRSNYFQNPGARRAIAYLIDRDYIVDELMDGCGVKTALPVHPGSGLYDESYASTFFYDPDEAARILEENGVRDMDGDGGMEVMVTGIMVKIRIKFIVNNDSAPKVAAARKLTEELNAIGMVTTLHELSWNDYLEALEEGDFDMYYGETRLRADWDMSELFTVPDLHKRKIEWKQNYARISDESYLNLCRAYLAAPEESRFEAFGALSRQICDSGVLLPVCFERREVLTHRGAVNNLHPTQYDVFNRFYEWNIDLG